MATERDDRIRQRAHQLWEEEGRPEGKHAEHWDRARSEIGGDDTPPARQLQEDPPEGDRDTIESELARRQQDDLNPGESES